MGKHRITLFCLLRFLNQARSSERIAIALFLFLGFATIPASSIAQARAGLIALLLVARLQHSFGVVDYRPRVVTSHRLGRHPMRSRVNLLHKRLRFSEKPPQS